MRKVKVHRMKAIAQEVKDTDKVLDLGADDCFLQRFINTPHYEAADIRQTRPGVKRVDFSNEHLPYKDRSFDKIVMSLLLSHIDNPTNLLQEAKRVLKDSGRLIVIVPNIENFNKLFHSLLFRKKMLRKPNVSHIYMFGTEEIINILARRGFKVIKHQKRYNELLGRKIPLPESMPLFANYMFIVAEKNFAKKPDHPYLGKKTTGGRKDE